MISSWHKSKTTERSCNKKPSRDTILNVHKVMFKSAKLNMQQQDP